MKYAKKCPTQQPTVWKSLMERGYIRERLFSEFVKIILKL